MIRSLWRRGKTGECLSQVRGVTTFPSTMKAWCLDGQDSTLHMEDVKLPSSLKSTEVLVELKAASLNPFDALMRNGFGSVAMSSMRRWKQVQEEPVILGRDFSGVVARKGRMVTRVKEGDHVWGTPAVWRPGTFSEYCCVNQDELAIKPKSLSHVEAASFPYVLCTAWSALCDTAGITAKNARMKRVFIVGGSGGIGTTAIQLMKAWGAHVTSTCSTDAIELVERLGTDHVIDYHNQDVTQEITDLPYRFDVILDTIGGNLEQFSCAKPCHGSTYILLAPPILDHIDQNGIVLGALRSGADFLSTALAKRFSSNMNYQWAYFQPNPAALNELHRNISQAKIIPIIDSVFDFPDFKEAFEKLVHGHLRGKVVLKIKP